MNDNDNNGPFVMQVRGSVHDGGLRQRRAAAGLLQGRGRPRSRVRAPLWATLPAAGRRRPPLPGAPDRGRPGATQGFDVNSNS